MATVIATQLEVSVVNGPPFFGLVLALFDGQKIELTIKDYRIGRVKATISSVGRELGGDKLVWRLTGTIFQTDYWSLAHYPHQFTGVYDPTTRKGFFMVPARVTDDENSLLLLQRYIWWADDGIKERIRLQEIFDPDARQQITE